MILGRHLDRGRISSVHAAGREVMLMAVCPAMNEEQPTWGMLCEDQIVHGTGPKVSLRWNGSPPLACLLTISEYRRFERGSGTRDVPTREHQYRQLRGSRRTQPSEAVLASAVR